jgi:transcriptional regulator with XRE-family HTH domain
MSIIECGGSTSGSRCAAAVALEAPVAGRPLHRIGAVRLREGISRRTLARRLGVDVTQVKSQEDASADMLLSTLYRWQEALEVPVAELLVESNDPLSGPVLRRAQMIRLMKTARTIIERAQQVSIRRMAQTLIEQLLEVMPELATVNPWHAVGQRRTRAELGQAAHRRLSLDWLPDAVD